jgi:Trm5-related predicted tRNA methylase
MAPRLLDEERKRKARAAGALLVAKKQYRERPKWLEATEARKNKIVRRTAPVPQAPRDRRWPPLQKPCACH